MGYSDSVFKISRFVSWGIFLTWSICLAIADGKVVVREAIAWGWEQKRVA